MKILSLILVLGLAVHATADQRQVQMMSANEDVLRSMVRAMMNRDAKMAASLFSDDATIMMSCVHGDCKVSGMMRIRQMLDDDLRAFTDCDVKIDSILCSEDQCMMAHRASGTHSGAWHGLQPFGARMENIRVMSWTRFSNGKVAEMRVVEDVHGVMEILTARTPMQKLMQTAWKIGEIWNSQRSISELMDILSDDFTGKCPLTRQNPIDRNMVIDEIKEWKQAFPDVSVTWKLSPGSRANELVSQWHAKGTFTKQYRDVPPTNQIVEFDGVSVMMFDKMGKIIRSKALFDSDDVLRQMKAPRRRMQQRRMMAEDSRDL